MIGIKYSSCFKTDLKVVTEYVNSCSWHFVFDFKKAGFSNKSCFVDNDVSGHNLSLLKLCEEFIFGVTFGFEL